MIYFKRQLKNNNMNNKTDNTQKEGKKWGKWEHNTLFSTMIC